ncbi:MAG TPA: cyclic nucleotide-binding domain-containing protein [Micromonosporaceae bacterium]|jgi:CRP-like cAMP-binding protein|nr:cyclic nucleotide-binding domain-containing protein [Micromonosporaceae bacterium]
MTSTRELLAEHPFLAGLPAGWTDRLAGTVRRIGYPASDRIFHEGGPAEHFWLIHTGRVALDIHVPGRGDVLIETLGPGAVLGWSWLFPPYRWHFGAVAAEQTGTVQFDAAAVMRLCQDDPQFGFELLHRFIGVVVDRLQTTRIRLLDLYGYPP